MKVSRVFTAALLSLQMRSLAALFETVDICKPAHLRYSHAWFPGGSTVEPHDPYGVSPNLEYDECCNIVSTMIYDARWGANFPNAAGDWLDVSFTVYNSSSTGVSGTGSFSYQTDGNVYEYTDIIDFCTTTTGDGLTVLGPVVTLNGAAASYMVLTIGQTSATQWKARSLTQTTLATAQTEFTGQCNTANPYRATLDGGNEVTFFHNNNNNPTSNCWH